MHGLRCGWVGQTFALAKVNGSNSDGRKSRIRRSKEERKEMVESFIKKYQKKNNGNFPSLNLTQKEVGGSFYTVREIFQEIIQENRVLGSAKLTPQEKKSDGQFSEEYILGSIVAEPQILLPLPPHENQPHLVSSLDELVGSSEEKHNTDNEPLIIKRSQVDLKNDESAVRAESGVVIDQPDASTSEVIDSSNVEVEALPLKSITEGADLMPETIAEIIVSADTLDDEQKAGLSSRLTTNDSQYYVLSSQEMSAAKDDRVDEDHGGLVEAVAESIYIGDSEIERNFQDPVLESSDRLKTKEGYKNGTESGKSSIGEESPHDSSPAEGPKDIKEDASVQATNAPNAWNGALPRTDTKKPFQETEIRSECDDPSDESIPKETDPTLNRINLGLREDSSRSSSRRQTNPLLAFVRAFIVSFLKAWSE